MEKEDERIMGDKAQGCGKWHRFTEVLREKVNNFCIRNSEKMVKWIDMYDRAQKERTESRKNFRFCNRGRAYPEELEALPKIYDTTMVGECFACGGKKRWNDIKGGVGIFKGLRSQGNDITSL